MARLFSSEATPQDFCERGMNCNLFLRHRVSKKPVKEQETKHVPQDET
jgi:hypothetical protein